ncbi:hypothetical protein EDD16DRAFT_1525997 [Pisolithus croceorrhizus]|nr:hypothetical protein EDD16DRAFT_1525997 [Pisolithus croceorrhizus]KAI6156161.1 hypothetical protein EDD17DRAFT_1512634 [Pisolithus thermaeus]
MHSENHHRTRLSEQLPSDSDAPLHESPSPQKKAEKGSGKHWQAPQHWTPPPARANGDLLKYKETAAAWERPLSNLLPTLYVWYKCTYNALVWYAMSLRQPLNNHKKEDTLCEVITEASCTSWGLCCTTSLEGGSQATTVHHWDKISVQPEPPISYGITLPLLSTEILCHIYLSARTCQELLEGKITMTTSDLLLFLGSRGTPGCNVDDENEYKDLFQGYYLERIMCHICTGPSTTLGKVSLSTHPSNDYHQSQTHCLWLSTESPDKDWVEQLKKWWNMSLFKSKMGYEASAGAMELQQDSDNVGSSASNNSLS